MVMRVTNQAQQANSLRNLFRITEDQFLANQRIASGKRILAPSDDPLGVRDVLTLRTSISRSEQFNRNVTFNRVFVNSADSALSSVSTSLIRAQELAVSSLNGINTAASRQAAAEELDQILDGVFQSANTQVQGRFLFSGTGLATAPFQQNGGGVGALYTGDTNRLNLEVAAGLTIPITRPGSEIFTVDLNPAVTPTTNLSDLNGGAGVNLGSISITDRQGNNAVVNLSGAATVDDVIIAINNATAFAGVNVAASINSAGDGLLLTDTSATINQALTVTESGGGTVAQELGILGSRNGNLTGQDLNPILTTATPISALNGGNGLTLGQVQVTNGALSGTVDLSGLGPTPTISDVLNAFNSAGLNLTASINSQGNGLNVVSDPNTSPNTTAVITDVSGGDTASTLGIGGNNIFVALGTLKQALERNDTEGIAASLDLVSASRDKISNARAEYGAASRTLDQMEVLNSTDVLTQTQQLSDVEDADFVQEAANLAALETALQATLATTARVLQPSLLDFLA
ncbi:flagellar hook-associated protein FlgL [Nitrospina watsonii]|uniref:Flagellar hook-associated protein flgL n=1 Tax=Nitrospina watsonii TaxID=1323948 RepID=A0ABM9HAG3_9BACT|nr:flagellar hook-associated protein FlgL [Nitrospina watsonii]CAI2717138.1 Flagellar hook-associated protein flgL [Nitrospina watsonii]